MKSFFFLVILFFSGCASSLTLSNAAKKVVFMKPKKGKCKLVKEKLSVSTWFYKRSSKNIRNKLQNEAAKLGGNTIQLLLLYHASDQAVANIYKCPEKYILSYEKLITAHH